MDTESGSVHVVDDIVYDMIASLNEYSKSSDIRTVVDEDDIKAVPYGVIKDYLKDRLPAYDESEIAEAYEEVAYLIEDESLFTDDLYEDYISDYTNRETVVKALCLHIAHDCNLACKYCFAGEGEYHGERALMTYEVGKKALDLLVRESKGRKNLEVDFFGGEPLMNFEVVKQLVEYGRSIEEANNKKFRFTLTTNGMLLDDEILEFANKEMGNLSERDFDTYMELFESMLTIAKLPDLMIYLRSSVPHLVSNIQKRGRYYEQSIQLDYLKNLNNRYEDFIFNKYKGKVLVVEVDDILAAADVDVLVVATGDFYPAGRGEGHPVSRQGAGCPPGLCLPHSPVKRQGVTWGTIITDTEAKNALGDQDSITNQSVTSVYPPPPNPSYLPEKYSLPSLMLILNDNY